MCVSERELDIVSVCSGVEREKRERNSSKLRFFSIWLQARKSKWLASCDDSETETGNDMTSDD